MAVLQQAFFTQQIGDLTPCVGRVDCDEDGSADISIHVDDAEISYHLSLTEHQDKENDAKATPRQQSGDALDDYVLMQYQDYHVGFHITPPYAGTYLFSVYAKNKLCICKWRVYCSSRS